MGLEAGVTKISDLNELWPLGTDERAQGDNHLRNIKVALLSLLTDLNQIKLGPASLSGQARKVLSVNAGETAYEVVTVASLLALAIKRKSTYEGTITGAGTSWSLGTAPTASDLLLLFRNGILMRRGALHEFTISGANVTLATTLDTANDETLEAWYI